MAGDGGYQIAVEGNTDLKGGIIASTQEAVNKGRNELTTGSITTSELINISTSKSEGSSISAGASFGWGNTGDNATNNGFKPSTPLSFKGKTDDQDLSITLSGISGGKLTITNEEEQRARTGQSAEEAAASVNTNVKTGQSVNALEKTWDTDKMLGEMQANLEIAEAFTREADQFRANQAKELDQLKLDMKKLEDGGQTHSQEYMDLKAAYEQQNRIWGKGGIGSLVTTALTGALSGNVSGSTSDLLQNAAVNVIQGLGADQIKDLITHLGKDNTDDGDALRAALQGILGCASASSQGGDCGTGAFGAAGAVIINKVIEDYFKGKEPEGMTEQEKQDRVNLVNTIIIGITEAVGGDANLAKVTATIEMENNSLLTAEARQRAKELAKYNPGKNKDVEELYYVAAMCHIRKCSAGLEEGTELYNDMKNLEELGGNPALQEYVNEVSKEKFTPPIVHEGFETPEEYLIPLYSSVDALADWSSRNQMGVRALGVVQAAGGGATMVIGGAACETGVACPAGIVLIALGADNAQAGAQTAYRGVPVESFTQAGLKKAGFTDLEAAAILGVIEIGGAAKINAALKIAGATGGLASSGKLLTGKQQNDLSSLNHTPKMCFSSN